MNTEQIQQAIGEMQDQLKSLQQAVELPTHYHNGFDSNQISWTDLYQKKVYISYTIPGTSAATSSNYSTFLIVPAKCLIVGAQEVHKTAGTDGSAVTLDIEKLTGVVAPGSGTSILKTTFSLKAAANTVQTAILTLTGSKSLAAGDRLAVKPGGTLTSVANVTVLVTLQI